MTLNLKAKIYTDETAARRHLEKLQWPDGPICPHCGVVNEATELQGESTRPGVYKCRPCQKPFSVTVGTVFERSKIPLTKWLLATQLLTSSKKGISSHQLARMLDVTYKTAWFMAHRIREAMTPVAGSEPPLGGDGFVVEADETEIAPSRKTRPRPRSKNLKFVSLVERDGKVRSQKIMGGKAGGISYEVRRALHANVDEASTLHTDGAQHYEATVRRRQARSREPQPPICPPVSGRREGSHEHGGRLFLDLQAWPCWHLPTHERATSAPLSGRI
jgi:transposase-like protein